MATWHMHRMQIVPTVKSIFALIVSKLDVDVPGCHQIFGKLTLSVLLELLGMSWPIVVASGTILGISINTIR